MYVQVCESVVKHSTLLDVTHCARLWNKNLVWYVHARQGLETLVTSRGDLTMRPMPDGLVAGLEERLELWFDGGGWSVRCLGGETRSVCPVSPVIASVSGMFTVGPTPADWTRVVVLCCFCALGDASL